MALLWQTLKRIPEDDSTASSSSNDTFLSSAAGIATLICTAVVILLVVAFVCFRYKTRRSENKSGSDVYERMPEKSAA